MYDEAPLLESDRDELLTKLHIWATGHQAPRQAFMARMGRSFSPIEFYELVRRALANERPSSEEDSSELEFGRGYAHYLREQSSRSQEPLTASLDRAIRANQVQR